MDVHTSVQRSKNMAAIKSTGTKCEVVLAKLLWAEGLRYRKNNKKVFGKPDFTFKSRKIAIFVDSEFFHGKDYETKNKPKSNTEFWEKKIMGNMERDNEVNEKLRSDGWLVIRFWAKDVIKNPEWVMSEIMKNFMR